MSSLPSLGDLLLTKFGCRCGHIAGQDCTACGKPVCRSCRYTGDNGSGTWMLWVACSQDCWLVLAVEGRLNT